MVSAAERFRGKVDQREDHDVWVGSRDAQGTGMVRIEGKLRTVQRAAWEFAHGPVPGGAKVRACPDERACVRVDHLRVSGPLSPPPQPSTTRPPRPAGTKREVRPGVWELAVSLGAGPSGTYRRHWERFTGIEAAADARLAALVESVRLPNRFGDMRVRELIDRYLTWLDDGPRNPRVTSWRRLNDEILDPAFGARRAVLVDTADVFDFLRGQHQAGTPRDVIKDLRSLLVQSWDWAQRRRWTDQSPPAEVRLRDVIY